MRNLQALREEIRKQVAESETDRLSALLKTTGFNQELRVKTTTDATDLVQTIRSDSHPGLMEVFLAEYGLSTNEGVALMCLAEALLRVPDSETIDALIEDKIAPSSWGEHLGRSSSSLVNASTWALMLTGKVLREEEDKGIAATLHNAVKRLGEPVIRTAVGRAIREMGHQFVLGRTIDEAVTRGRKYTRRGYTFSYDMLGEAALTEQDARKYADAYGDAISKLAAQCKSVDIRENPGISVKLSALHPRYEGGQKDRVMRELVNTTRKLARQSAKAGMGFNIDAEEADRLDLSLDVIEAVLRDPDLSKWDGFGVVVQAYGKRAAGVLDWLYGLAKELDRKIMVRLVKGAYWDSEIKRAQVEGLQGFPVFTHKAATDQSYILCAEKLLKMTDRIYPQFATHNAHSVAAILNLSHDRSCFEFQRLQGMGESLHQVVQQKEKTRCRIYAPVGTHRDLLAYLVRRLLENGANSSFVNQIVDEDIEPKTVAADPFELSVGDTSAIKKPDQNFGPDRLNSKGWDLHDLGDLEEIEFAREKYKDKKWRVGPLISGKVQGDGETLVTNPALPKDQVGHVVLAAKADVETALSAAKNWSDTHPAERRKTLEKAADLYEENFGELFAVLCREAGKTPADAIAELREAVDFLRYYALEGEANKKPECGIFTCISPWNFPLAIFTGQISAALAAGNGVLAKPAEATGITASLGVSLLHKAGVPREVLQLLPGTGSVVGAALTSDPLIDGVCFTGSTATAQTINKAMAQHLAPTAPLIAETGGLNAMIVDSTALPEQAIKDIILSAFQSAGQRCSALRMLYIQEDISQPFLEMLFGAMDELVVGDPWSLATDVGPVIDRVAQDDIGGHIEAANSEGRLLKQLQVPNEGNFVSPAAIRVGGIGDLHREVFGPVLHIATFKADQIDRIVDDINGSGYGLTFGMHSRIDDRVEQVTARMNAGNIYINRNQIGAIVGSQPFGGEGLSGTGPKAGGPNYLPRFKKVVPGGGSAVHGNRADPVRIQKMLDQLAEQRPECLGKQDLPGPTGESNQLSIFGRGVVLCLGPGAELARQQSEIAHQNGCPSICVAAGLKREEGVDGVFDPSALADLTGFELVAHWGNAAEQSAIKRVLAARDGQIIPLSTGDDLAERSRLERHICIDTTAAGGNASLLASVS